MCGPWGGGAMNMGHGGVFCAVRALEHNLTPRPVFCPQKAIAMHCPVPYAFQMLPNVCRGYVVCVVHCAEVGRGFIIFLWHWLAFFTPFSAVFSLQFLPGLVTNPPCAGLHALTPLQQVEPGILPSGSLMFARHDPPSRRNRNGGSKQRQDGTPQQRPHQQRPENQKPSNSHSPSPPTLSRTLLFDFMYFWLGGAH